MTCVLHLPTNVLCSFVAQNCCNSCVCKTPNILPWGKSNSVCWQDKKNSDFSTSIIHSMITKVLLLLEFNNPESKIMLTANGNASWHHVTKLTLYLAYEQALLFGWAKQAAWEHVREQKRCKGLSCAPRFCVSSCVPLVHLLFTISPKWKACSQATLYYLFTVQLESDVHHKP